MSNTATIIASYNYTRKFGIELEFFGLTHRQVRDVLGGIGIFSHHSDDYSCSHYCDDDCDDGCCHCCDSDCIPESPAGSWRVGYDGSINSRGNGQGVEICSPILSGQDGMREVEKVVKALDRAGAKVNKSCGFHVHVNANDLSSQVLMNTVRRYAANENQIDAFMAPSRRNNSFCKSNLGMLRALDGFNPTNNARMLASAAEYYDRYYKVNLCAFLRHGTIEFRQHGGTMNAEKVVNWIAFCVNFVEKSTDSSDAPLFEGVHPDSVEFYNARAGITTETTANP